jgi:hypothetical protein
MALYQKIERYFPEEYTLHIHRRENIPRLTILELFLP